MSDLRSLLPTGSSGAGRPSRAELLFRAAVAAFCALTRPPRAEIDRLDALTLSLLDHVPPAARRFAAAAFSEAAHAPPGLVRRLSEDSIDVAAPLLARSPMLSDIDLVAIIGRHGLAYARAISRRHDLNPAIAGLIGVLLRQSEGQSPGDARAQAAAESPADGVREKLRAMMGDGGAERRSGPNPYARLRDAALDGHLPFFHTALADATGLSFAAARRVAEDPRSALPAALQALGLAPEQSFLIVSATHPGAVIGPVPIRAFLRGFAAPPRGRGAGDPPAAEAPLKRA